MAAAKVAQQRTHTGSFTGDQAQRQAQIATVKTNAHVDAIAVLNNRAYVALTVDSTLAGSAGVYTTLLTTSLTTLLATGFVIVTFTASCTHNNAGATTYFKVFVDGVAVRGCYATVTAGGEAFCEAILIRVPVTKGTHVVLLKWSTDNNTVRINAKTSANEHAAMLVQEAA